MVNTPGMICTFPDNATNHHFVSSMRVVPKYRRAGVGRQLFMSAHKWLPHNGAQNANNWVVSDNTQAISIYNAPGFVATDEYQPLPSGPKLEEQLYVYSESAI